MKRLVLALTATVLAVPGTALATGAPAEQSPYAAMAMYLVTPHDARPAATDDKAFEAAVEEKRRQRLAEWTDAYSRDVYPGYGISNVHGPAAR